MAVWLVSLLLERSLVELLQTEAANETFRVEFPEHGRDAATRDWLATHCTQRASGGVVAGLAVRETFMLEERSVSEWFLAFFAYKTVRMPLFI